MEDKTAPFVMPSEDEFKALPIIGRDESPHKNSPAVAMEGPSDLLSATLFQANTGDYAAPIIPYHVATANLPKAVHAQIDKNPSVYLILVMFLGGTYFFRRFTNVADEIQKTLAGIAGPNGISLSLPAPNTLVEERDKYSGPMAVVAKCASTEIRDAIASHSTYPASTDLAFHALIINKIMMSWVVGHFACTVRGNGGDIADAFRWLVAEALMISKDPTLRQQFVRATQPGATDPADTRVYNITRTVFAVYIEHDKDPFWVLYMRPCTDDQGVWDSLTSALRNRVYSDGFHTFTPLGYKPGKTLSRPCCHMCKLDCHLAYVCKFSKAYWAWSGPPDVITTATTGVLALPTRPARPPAPRGGFQGKAGSNRSGGRGGN